MTKPTQAAIAKKLGISKMTVSRALRGEVHVSAEVRQRVQEAAMALGYRPDPEVARLMTHLRQARSVSRGPTLAFVWTEATVERQANPWSRGLYEGAEQRAMELGYTLEGFQLDKEAMTAGRLARVLEHRGVRGMMLSPLVNRSRGHLRMPWAKFSVVAIGLGLMRPAFHRVHHHHFLGMMTALRQLRKAGYRRIGMVVPAVLDRRMFGAWSAAFLVHHPLGVQAAGKLMHLPQTLTRATFLDWCRKERPEVVLDSGQMTRAWLSGLPGSERPLFATLNWYEGCGAIAGLDQRPDLIGRTATDLLVEQMQVNERGVPAQPKIVMMEGVWCTGLSETKIHAQQEKGQ